MRHARAHSLGVLAALALCAACGAGSTPEHPTSAQRLSPSTDAVASTSALAKLRQVKHVFVIVEENEDESNTFGNPAKTPYLAKTLRRKGLLLKDYYAIGHVSNDNYIALISGQEPNTDTQADCQLYTNFPAAERGKRVPNQPDQQLGVGCVYPSDIKQIGQQLSAHHRSWKAYMGDMGNIPSREAAACGHPTLGTRDQTQTAAAGDGYATRHNPFAYFHDVIDNTGYCDRHVVALGSPHGALPRGAVKGETGLAKDLERVKTTPAYSFITPNLCDDGHDYPCKNGEKSGSSAQADIDRFLKIWVPKILHSPAFRKNGLLEITFDESDGPQTDSSACCGEGTDPDATATAGRAGLRGPGGGKIGALLISPFIKANTTSTHPYNHYSTLATDEAIFRLPKLGFASLAQVFSGSAFRRKH